MQVPKYTELKSALRQKIVRGEFVGGMLPSESALRIEYGVGTKTIVRALGDLRAEGLVRRHQGKGTFVNTDHSPAGRIGILTYLAQTGDVKSVYPRNLLQGLLGRLRELGEAPHIYSFFGEGLVPDFLEHGQKVLEHAAGGRLQCLVVTGSYEPDEIESEAFQPGQLVRAKVVAGALERRPDIVEAAVRGPDLGPVEDMMDVHAPPQDRSDRCARRRRRTQRRRAAQKRQGVSS